MLPLGTHLLLGGEWANIPTMIRGYGSIHRYSAQQYLLSLLSQQCQTMYTNLLQRTVQFNQIHPISVTKKVASPHPIDLEQFTNTCECDKSEISLTSYSVGDSSSDLVILETVLFVLSASVEHLSRNRMLRPRSKTLLPFPNLTTLGLQTSQFTR